MMIFHYLYLCNNLKQYYMNAPNYISHNMLNASLF